MIIYIAIIMSVIEEISRMSKSGCDHRELLDYIYGNYDEVESHNHTMKPLRRKCVYKRSDNVKVILNQFFHGGKQFVPDDVMEAIRAEIHDGTDIL